MDQTTQHTHWGTAQPPSPGIPRAGKISLIGIGVLVAALLGAAVLFGGDDTGDSSGDFYAAPGWTVERAVDLELDLRRDAGFSDTSAECTMKVIVGSTSWLEWRALSNAGQLRAIRTASTGC